ncbi:hypothetical protein [Bradyrhizobium sp. HKCCYLR20261]|uniref:hypothetical protein n=1 Tax=Bradyrhizobium sp. HKCCYLR20261 TaxID=3420760 RepID=UPI003EBEBCC6
MADLIIDGDQPQLRQVMLTGHAARRSAQKSQRDARFFWVLSATAPYFGRQNTFDEFNRPSGVTADHVYPLRLLTADQPRAGGAGGPPWRRPRLIDLHLLVGATNPAYAERAGDADRLIFSFSQTSRIEVRARKGAVLQTFAEADEPSTGVDPRKAPFVRTVVEPLPVDDRQWPPPSDDSKVIPVPPLRLVAGRVGLRALMEANGHPTDGLAWLTKLGIESTKEGNAVWARIWLVPDGIEFDARFNAFPGSRGHELRGRVLLSSDEEGRFFLNLLSAADGAEKEWRDAWTRITPAVRENREDYLLGLKFAAAHDGRIPGFRWSVTMKDGVPSTLGPLEVPQRALRVEMVSPSENGDVDGVAPLATGWVGATESAGKVTFKFGQPATATAPSALRIACLPKSIAATFGTLQPLGVHVDQLATNLRSAYGLEHPPPVPPVEPGSPAGPAFARPLLPAFVPLADGWLQLPVPNVGPRDTNQDLNLTVRPPEKQKTSMFDDGFFRLKRLGLPPHVLSTGGEFGPGSQAPWAVTVAKPAALYGVVEVEPANDPDPRPGVSPAALLAKADIWIDGFSLSARGLVWMSADRPDAFEALPRLGAGPGSFVDLPFESDAQDLLRVNVSTLAIATTRVDDKPQSHPMEVEQVDLAIDFNVKGNRWIDDLLRPKEARAALQAAVTAVEGKMAAGALDSAFAVKSVPPWSPVVWRRHHTIPLAAAMPMTRAAAGGVRPLESRDLIPFALETKAAGEEWRRLATLRVVKGKPFAELVDAALRYKLVSSWPTDPGADETGSPDRGIAFAALGLPGVELRPLPDAGLHNPVPYHASLRFDLPALDEAFATAPLPPQPGGPASKEEREAPPPRPVATALDWPLLAEFWSDQERKHQNSRVVDSYMMPFRPVDGDADRAKVDVKTLVKGLTWGGVSIQVGTKVAAGKLPYGSLSIDNSDALSGNAVLRGFDGKFTPNLATRILQSNGGPLEVVGFSPATFRDRAGGDDYFDLDNRLTGIKPPVETPVGVLSRPVMLPDMKDRRLVSLLTPVSIGFKANGIVRSFQFWFKDVLFQDGKALLDGEGNIAFDIWNDEQKLASAGFEWRLVPANPIDAELAFRLGRSQLPFFGFWLEPLRLTALSMKDDKVSAASILCRLTLGEQVPLPDPGLNLVTLSLIFDDQGQCTRASFDDRPLQFSFVVADKRNPRRNVVVNAQIKPTESSAFDLAIADLTVDVAGVGIRFDQVSAVFAEAVQDTVRSETVRFTAAVQPNLPAPGKGRLRVTKAELEAGLRVQPVTPPPPRRASLALTYRIEIVPRGEEPTSPTGSFGIELDNVGAGKFSFLGQSVDLEAVSINEGDGALVMAIPETSISTSWMASLGFVARLCKSATAGTADLAFGHCEGEVVAQEPSVALGKAIDAKGARLRFTLSGVGSGSDWKGTATVTGKVIAKNAISWPSIGWGSTPTIPLPGDPKQSNGRITVKPGAGVAASHIVTWTFLDHRLDLALAAAVAEKSPVACWTTPVTARHELSRDGKTLSWTGVETIAVGYPKAMIPVPTANDADFDEDTTTFAARYRGKIVKSEYVSPDREPGMHRPGLGAVATVLQGAFGAAFRKAFWNEPSQGLMVMGGFLGALRLSTAAATPLLRLPVLAGLDAGMIKQTLPGRGIELSWTDGPAARLLALTRPGTPSPADASLDALRAAALAGSLPLPPTNEDSTWDDPAGALLVEQSYVNADLTKDAQLASTPFFLASAVTVERIFRMGEASLPAQVEALSLVAGASVLRKRGNTSSLSLAAAMALRDKDLPASPKRPAPRFALVGEKLTVADWTGPLSGESDASPMPVLNGLAVARDAIPRAAFVAVPAASGASVATYIMHVFPAAIADVPPVPTSPAASFADHGRGAVAVPDPTEPLRWLAPAIEGAGTPIRDYDKGLDQGSGLAGLARRVRLPAHAGEKIDLASTQAESDFIWFSQTQVPIYLPLQTKGMKGPPIGWLTPASPQVRLPVVGDVLQAIRASNGNDDAVLAGRSREVQPFLPQEISAASVGERAGIMTARRARLLSGLGTIGMFDPMYSRFGRPAQGGSSFARQLRTPRPARLPANTGNALRDRRIEASPVDPTAPFTAVIGSADIVEGVSVGSKPGEVKYGAWSISVVAAPEWQSTTSDLWDGTIRLVCRMIVVSEDAPVAPPRELLGQVLIEGVASKLETRAILKLGKAIIPFSQASFTTTKDWTPHAAAPIKTFRAEIAVTLVPRGATRQIANPDIAAAFSVPGPLPAAEIQWTVHPSSARVSSVVVQDGALPLMVADPDKPELAQGSDRAPVTLRMPLYPVTAIRGALPLTPATLLFADPAYDRDLAGPPVGDGKRLELTDAARQLLPGGRGDLKLVLTADRGQLNRRGTVTFMLDVRFERQMDDIAQAVAEANGAASGGDLMKAQPNDAAASMRLELQPKGEPSRPLRFAKDQVAIKLGSVYELPLAAVTEADGTPARLSAGDILVMETALNGVATAVLWNSVSANATASVDLLPKPPAAPNAPREIPSCSLRFVLTDDPVIEPPPALFAALLRTGEGAASRLSVPLHAQSPLPWRVDLVEPARDFRRGMMRRHAAFVWTLVRPSDDFRSNCVFVIKADRNGQTYLPERESEFLKPEEDKSPAPS